MLKMTAIAAFASLVTCWAASSSAAIVQYEDRTAWDAAAGAVSFAEDFEGIAAGTSFLNTPAALNQMTIEATGRDGPNIIDNDLEADLNVNGSRQAYAATGYLVNTVISLVFAAPVSAWGATFRNHEFDETLVIDVISTSDAVLGTLDGTTNGPSFLGFTTTANEQIGSLLFRSAFDSSGIASFGFDDIVGVTSVPEPAALTLFGLGLAGLGLARRRRRP